MTRLIDPSQYFTRYQSDARYLGRSQPAPPPIGLSMISTALSATPGYSSVVIELIDPSIPFWADTGGPYVYYYMFDCTPTIAGVAQATNTITLPYSSSCIYTLPALISGANYSISARTVDYTGQPGTESTAVEITTTTNTSTPTAITITAAPCIGGAQIVLSALNTDPDFSQYELYRGNGYVSSPVSWGVAPIIVATFTNVMIPNGVFIDHSIPATSTDYYYYIVEVNLSGNTTVTPIVGPLSLVGTSVAPPPTPSLVTASGTVNSDGSIIISFQSLTLTTAPTVTSYNIYRRITGTAQWLSLVNLPTTMEVNSTTITYIDTYTIIGMNYTYGVTSVDSYGDESSMDTDHLIMVTSTVTTTIAAPSDVVLTGVQGGVNVSWLITRGAVGYEICYRFAQVGSSDLTSWSDPINVQSNSYTIFGLEYPESPVGPPTRDVLANSFEVSLRSYNSIMDYSPYSYLIATYPDLNNYFPADTSLPPAPIKVTPVISNAASITLTWTAPVTNSLAGYQIEQQSVYDDTPSSWSILALINDPTAGTKSFIANGLEPYAFTNTSYIFRVRSVDTSGNLSSPNLVFNPGFEDVPTTSPFGIPFWSYIGDAPSIITTDTRNNSLRAMKQDGTTQLSQSIEVIGGLVYTASCFVTSDPAINGSPNPNTSVQMQITFSNTLGLSETYNSNRITTNIGYQRLVVTATAPIAATIAKVTLLNDPTNTAQTAIWDDAQVEQCPFATIYADGKTEQVNAVETSGPQPYLVNGLPLVLSIAGSLGAINLSWINPSRDFSGYYDYINGAFEIWRMVTVSEQSNMPVSTSYIKIAEVPSFVSASGITSYNSYSDLQPEENNNITASYELRGIDRFGNEGNQVLAGPLSATSQTPNDIQIVTDIHVPPPTPILVGSGCGAVANSDGSISVSWNGITSLDCVTLGGYNLWRMIIPSGTTPTPLWNSLLATISIGPSTGGDIVTFIDTSTNPGALYWYNVSSFDRVGNQSPPSSTYFTCTSANYSLPEPVPSGSVIGTGTMGAIVLTWSPSPSNINQYKVYWSNNYGTSFTSFTVSGTTATVVLTSGDPAALLTTDFSAHITALSISPNSSTGLYVESAPVSMNTPPDLTGYMPQTSGTPAPPASITATPQTSTDITLSWPASTSTDINYYIIESQSTNNNTMVSSPWCYIGTVPAPSTGYRVSGLQSSTISQLLWTFRIWSVNNTSVVSATPAVSSPVPVLIDTTPPAIPVGLSGTFLNSGSTATATICWTPNIEPDFDHYLLQYQASSLSGTPTSINVPGITPTTTITGLPQSISYNFMVAAGDTLGNTSAFCSPLVITSTTGSGTVPTAPTVSETFTAPYSGILTITYTPPSNFTCYSIYRATTSSQGSLLGTCTTSTYTDFVMSYSNITYYYCVTATNSSGLSSVISNIVSITYTGTGSNGACPAENMWVTQDKQAKQVVAGDLLDILLNNDVSSKGLVISNSHTYAACVELKADNGATVIVSRNTPMVLKDNTQRYASEMQLQLVATDIGNGIEWSPVTVYDAGIRRVCHIYLGGKIFAAGSSKDKRVYTHNSLAYGPIRTK